MPVNPYASIPQQFAPPIRRNLETGYNLYSKLAEQKEEDIKKRTKALDDRTTLLEFGTSELEALVKVNQENEKIRRDNLDAIAQDLDLRFRTPGQTVITQPIYIGTSPGDTSLISRAPASPKQLSPGGIQGTGITPGKSFADALKTPSPKTKIKAEPETEMLYGGDLKTADQVIDSLTNKKLLVFILNKYHNENISDSVGIAKLRQLLKEKRHTSMDIDFFTREFMTNRARERSSAGGGGARTKKT